MELLVAISTRYYRTNDGKIWTSTSYNAEMWKETLSVFNKINVVARLIDVNEPPVGANRADGPEIKFTGLPEWNSWKLIYRQVFIRKKINEAVENCDGVFLHSPSLEAKVVFNVAYKRNIPVALICRGDQSMNMSYWEKRKFPLPSLLAYYHKHQFSKHVRNSWGCIYVSNYLKEKYHPSDNHKPRAEVISDIRIPDRFFKEPVAKELGNNGIDIVNVGRLEAQKDINTLIKACNHIDKVKDDIKWNLHIVGKGPLYRDLENTAIELNIDDKVTFHGYIPWGDRLFKLLDRMDLFVLSSISEGMPRALLEAMARGLPCVSTNVSGANELLPNYALVPIGNYKVLGDCIASVINGNKLSKLSKECWSEVQRFRMDNVVNRKKQFLMSFKEYLYENK